MVVGQCRGEAYEKLRMHQILFDKVGIEITPFYWMKETLPGKVQTHLNTNFVDYSKTKRSYFCIHPGTLLWRNRVPFMLKFYCITIPKSLN